MAAQNSNQLNPTEKNLEIIKEHCDKCSEDEMMAMLRKEICSVLKSVEDISPNELSYQASMENSKPLFDLYKSLSADKSDTKDNIVTAASYAGGIALVCLLELGGRVLLSKGLHLLPKPKMKN